ncbi:F5/8 type C domain-containing protein [Parapedobacter composti]|uniref:F5/8 type C domain-containing protein n=1 Tax=Parapedobacter composti TaxID=623281 RepID=A0A1I1IDY5_9SPHI|nr:family 43 glycosylhydrolase [Parapedobacter composti]SFC34446.1 F5/8 type C domain-containing protein [Parapedobacter composti]
MKRTILIVACAGVLSVASHGVSAQALLQRTYCNPLNLDYAYATRFDSLSYRSGADPTVVEFRGDYYMFVTRSMGYWYSPDLHNWTFVRPEKWYFEGSNAPTAHNYKDSVLYVTGNPVGAMAILYTDNPKRGDWKAVPSVLTQLQDPDLFIDDDGQAYMFWGSSNKFPIRAKKLDRTNRFIPMSKEVYELFNLDGERHGWERFGHNHSDTVLRGYIEGASMLKRGGKYYLQYAAPGTQFDVYGDGVYIADAPLGPYRYASNNPFSYKPGGFINGAGHGSTVEGPAGHYWHFSTMAVDVNIGWERRIGMFPTYFDADGLMHANTAYGDYPHYAPHIPGKMGTFTGWMLLSYQKPVTASSQLGSYGPEHVTDEQVKTFWVAEDNGDTQWLQIDLQRVAEVHAIQVNFNDYQSDLYGKPEGLFHRYAIEGSENGQDWRLLVDRQNSFRDVPNDYVELENPAHLRYIRYRNIHVPTPYLSISGLRIFGVGSGKKPVTVKNLEVVRDTDRRDAQLTWDAQENVQGYTVRWGIAPDKLYSAWMLYGQHALEIKGLTVDQSYYFTVEAFNENGISGQTAVKAVE